MSGTALGVAGPLTGIVLSYILEDYEARILLRIFTQHPLLTKLAKRTAGTSLVAPLGAAVMDAAAYGWLDGLRELFEADLLNKSYVKRIVVQSAMWGQLPCMHWAMAAALRAGFAPNVGNAYVMAARTGETAAMNALHAYQNIRLDDLNAALYEAAQHNHIPAAELAINHGSTARWLAVVVARNSNNMEMVNHLERMAFRPRPDLFMAMLSDPKDAAPPA